MSILIQGWLEVINVVNDSCTLKCYGGGRQLRALAQKVPAVAAAAARLRERGESGHGESAGSYRGLRVPQGQGSLLITTPHQSCRGALTSTCTKYCAN